MFKNKIKWNSERLLSFSAMTISFITLVIFIYQTNLMRKQNYLSILPYVMLSTSANKETQTFEVNLVNHGVGPAIIESVILKYKGKQHDLINYENHLYTFLVSQVPALDSIKTVSSSTLDKGMAIPANYKYNVLSVGNSEKDYQLILDNINRLLDEGLDYEIIYKSIQNERWLIRNNSLEPKKLN